MSPNPTGPGFEPDHPPLQRIYLLVFGVVSLLVLILAILWQVLQQTARQEVRSQDLGRPSPALQQVRERDRARLQGYSLVEGEAGVYRIPTSRAAAWLLAHPQRLAPAESAPAEPSGAGEAAP